MAMAMAPCKSSPWLRLCLADCAAVDFFRQKPAEAVAAASSPDCCRAGALRCKQLPPHQRIQCSDSVSVHQAAAEARPPVGGGSQGKRRRGRPPTVASGNGGRHEDAGDVDRKRLAARVQKSFNGVTSTSGKALPTGGSVTAEAGRSGRAAQTASVNGNAKSTKQRRKSVVEGESAASAQVYSQLLAVPSIDTRKGSSSYDESSHQDLEIEENSPVIRKKHGRSKASSTSPRSLRFSGDEKDLRFLFMEYLMDRVRNGDITGAEQAITQMAMVGLRPGPHAFHGLLVAYARSRNADGALQVLRRELGLGIKPLPETFCSLAKLFGAAGLGQRGLEILAAMEKIKLDPQRAWIVLVEELCNSGHLKKANEVFLMGAKGLKASEHICALLVSGNCDVGDHANAIDVMEVMEIHGVQPTTYHYNYLLKAQANADRPDIAAITLEDMHCGRDNMKPDVESYNWVIQAYTRHTSGDRLEDLADLVGQMIEDHKQVQPNARTYALLVECFVKYNVVDDAIRHFRALSFIPGAMHILHNDGKHGDPLSLYLRSLALEGQVLELLQALEAMEKENIPLASRAMLVNRKGRTLVSSWIEPLQQEADIGCDVDYVSRFIEEGGVTGTRKRWIPSSGISQGSCDPDYEGFRFGPPAEISFKENCESICRMYNVKRIEKLRREGVQALGGDATEEDLEKVMELLTRQAYLDISEKERKPKAASKMLVAELKGELEAQGLPADGTRPVLYQRVQKARRINRARGRPLWLPPVEDNFKIDERASALLSGLTLENDITEYWQKRFLEDDVAEIDKVFVKDEMGKISSGYGFVTDDDEEDAEDETERVKNGGGKGTDQVGEDEVVGPSNQPESKEVVEEQNEFEEAMYELPEEKKWKPLTLKQKFSYLRRRKHLILGLKTLEDAWNWTWEKQIRTEEPEQWSQEREVDLGIHVFKKVVHLGGTPTIGDCSMLLRASMRTPLPNAMVHIIQESHKLGHVFGSNLYSETVSLCMSVGEKDAAIAIIADMEEAGQMASNDLLNQVLVEL